MKKKSINSVIDCVHEVTKNPESFLRLQSDKHSTLKKQTKKLFDLSQKHATKGNVDNLEVCDMDEEQIWQQIEMRNEAASCDLLTPLSKLLAENTNAVQLAFQGVNDNDSSEESSEDAETVDQKNFFDNESEGSENENFLEKKSAKSVPKHRTYKKSEVDDKFFKLREMEEFLIAEDKKEMGKSMSSNGDITVDFFNDPSSDDEDAEDKNFKYNDFFDDNVEHGSDAENGTNGDPREDNGFEKNEEKDFENEELSNEDFDAELLANPDARDTSSDDESDVEEKNEPKSTYEMRQERLRQKIQDQEEQALGDKPWQLKGEVVATSRPQNSLLAECLEFDSTVRPAPVITEETTMRLEDIIKQRIKDKAWDNVEKKFKPKHVPMDLRKKLILDQEKSKQSLAQIYENEFQAQVEKANGEERPAEEKKEHIEIKKLMKSLFIRLDALSNFHYTPKPATAEPRIITNTPAIQMEEVAPIGISSSTLLAPEEIRKRVTGELLGKTERSTTDKNRERRRKKLKQKTFKKIEEEREKNKQELGLKSSVREEKSKTLKNVTKSRQVSMIKHDNTSIKSSKLFFSKLQEESEVNPKRKAKKVAEKANIPAKRLKL